ncbi:MAG: beta-galactosidase [Anaerolineae bacterium]
MDPLVSGKPYPQTHTRPTRLSRILFGAPYYPEHWDPSMWERDAQLMAEAHVNVVRMGEFAWDRMEPHEGTYDFSLFHEVVDLLSRYGICTILCTPTATPPRWLTRNYPDVLRVLPDGRRCTHGSRQHACYAGEVFRAHSRRITHAMAEAFAGDPHIVGWQTDNEINCFFSECICPNCQIEYRRFLENKYTTIEQLNRSWGTAFWALTYQSFEDIDLPYERLPQYENPSARLDYYRYLSHIGVRFQREQVQELRAANPAWFVMHNGTFEHLDYWEFSKDLDFLGFDNYPGFTASNGAEAAQAAATVASRLERARSYAGNFIIPEQQSGPGGQKPGMHDTPRPGEMRLWSYQSIAHGADGILHFRWRTCRFGAEEYWCGILDHDAVPRRRYTEAKLEGAEFAALSPHLLGTHVRMDAAILLDVDQDDAHKALPFGLPTPSQASAELFRELWLRKVAVGYVNPNDSLEGITLLVVPHMPMCDEALAAKLAAYVEAGGTLLIGGRSAIKNLDNVVNATTPPGLLAGLAGITVEEYGMHAERHYRIQLGQEVPPALWYDALVPTSAEVLGTWLGGHLDGMAAVTRNVVGQGQVLYVGTYLAAETAGWIADLACETSGIQPLLEGVPEPVEVTERLADDRRLLFLLNHADEPHTVQGLPAGMDLLRNSEVGGALTLAPRQVVIVSLSLG